MMKFVIDFTTAITDVVSVARIFCTSLRKLVLTQFST